MSINTSHAGRKQLQYMQSILLGSNNFQFQLVQDCLDGHDGILPHHSDSLTATCIHSIQSQQQTCQHLLQIDILLWCSVGTRQLLHSNMQAVCLGDRLIYTADCSFFGWRYSRAAADWQIYIKSNSMLITHAGSSRCLDTVISCVNDFVYQWICLSVCPCFKSKLAWAINTKTSRHIVHGNP